MDKPTYPSPLHDKGKEYWMEEQRKVDYDIEELEKKPPVSTDDKKKMATYRLRAARIEVECNIVDYPDNTKWNRARELIGELEDKLDRDLTSETKAAIKAQVDELYNAASKADIYTITKPDLDDLFA